MIRVLNLGVFIDGQDQYQSIAMADLILEEVDVRTGEVEFAWLLTSISYN
jgi:hypothetical protein